MGCVMCFFFIQDGWTALHFAALKSFQKIVKILVEYGSNINLQDPVLIFFFLFLLSEGMERGCRFFLFIFQIFFFSRARRCNLGCGDLFCFFF